MPRKRYIKPGFFKNDELAALPALVRILYAGLWCWADREGRLEDRPLRIKGDIIPYDKLDVNKALNQLQEGGFLLRYTATVGGKPFKAIQIYTFEKHQDVHVNEQKSTIPAPCEAPPKHGADTVQSTVQAPDENGGNTPFNLELSTLRTFNLTVEEVEVLAQARKKLIEEACKEDLTPQGEEKEKGCAEKENAGEDGPGCHGEPVEAQPFVPPPKKPFPTTAEAMNRIITEAPAQWRNVLQHHIAKGVKGWSKLGAEGQKPYYDRREEMFKRFYEYWEDTFRIRYPSVSDMAKHFYHWTEIQITKTGTIKTLNETVTNHASNKHIPANGQNRQRRSDSVAELIANSGDFLQEHFSDEPA